MSTSDFTRGFHAAPYLRISFWGTSFFKSVKSETEVRLGTTLYVPILTNATEQEEKITSILTEAAMVVFSATIFLTIPFLAMGALLPTFVFLSSAQILAHLPLIDPELPPAASFLARSILKFFTLEWLFGRDNTENTEMDWHVDPETSFVWIRNKLGYTCNYARMLTLIVFVLLIVSLGQLIFRKSV